eukprot:CAMPEP_0184303404 /NCGR_PEP_ID=MMETSP1049-20130417/13160_1 /TAXON_ID=77928 /ORGANISM="Proteomonas sulcata, Strain CCMP704" /LENGTH=115 /DNA_ID=CAMNT_0026614939 /DNA_START=182 /DNA_END=529 /DNA_ORIENTATION=+
MSPPLSPKERDSRERFLALKTLPGPGEYGFANVGDELGLTQNAGYRKAPDFGAGSGRRRAAVGDYRAKAARGIPDAGEYDPCDGLGFGGKWKRTTKIPQASRYGPAMDPNVLGFY